MDAQTLYTERADDYVSFASTFSHQQGVAGILLANVALRGGMRILDAGCGTGFASLAVLDALGRRGLEVGKIDAFDLTPAMLQRFEATVRARALPRVDVRQADARNLDGLPDTWTGYDLIISVSMLEYIEPRELPAVLRALRRRLSPGGQALIIITRKNPITWLLIERSWQAHRHTRSALRRVLLDAGFSRVRFLRYPLRYLWLGVSNHVVLASGGP